MPFATLDSKGEITLPKSVRDGLGVDTGDRVEFVDLGRGFYPMIAATRDIWDLRGSIPKPLTPISVKAMKSALRQYVARRNTARG